MAEYYHNNVKSKGFNRITCKYHEKIVAETQIIVPEGNIFGLDPISTEMGYPHQGLDIASDLGNAIPAAADGTVYKIENEGQTKGYGHFIVLQHKDQNDQDIYTIYAQMLTGSTLQPGQKVQKGTTVGYVGKTGNATGPHVHFEIREGNYVAKKTLDPQTYDLSQLKTVAKAESTQSDTSEEGAESTAGNTAQSQQEKPAIEGTCTTTACTEDQLIIQVIGKDHPAGHSLYITDENDKKVEIAPDKESILNNRSANETTIPSKNDKFITSVLHKWDWEKQKNTKRAVWMEIPSSDGPIKFKIINVAVATPKREDDQIHQIIPIVPCTVVKGLKSDRDTGVPALARAGYFYIFQSVAGKRELWRELQIKQQEDGTTIYKDVPLFKYLKDNKITADERKATGTDLKEIWIPNVWNYPVNKDSIKATLEKTTYDTFFYSEVQLSKERLNLLLNKTNVMDAHPKTSLLTGNIRASVKNLNSFFDIPKGEKLLNTYENLESKYNPEERQAIKGQIAILNLMSSLNPATVVAPHRPRNIDYEQQFIHPGHYLYDLGKSYVDKQTKLANEFLSYCDKGEQMPNSQKVEPAMLLTAVNAKIKEPNKAKNTKLNDFGKGSPVTKLLDTFITETNQNIESLQNKDVDICQVIPDDNNALQDAHDREIYCVTVPDLHFHTRQLTSNIMLCHELLGAVCNYVAERKYVDSAMLVSRLTEPSFKMGQTTLANSLKKLSPQGIKKLAYHSGAYERAFVASQFTQLRQALFSTFSGAGGANDKEYIETWADHMSLNNTELYTPAYYNLVMTLAIMSLSIAGQDQFSGNNSQIYLDGKYLGGYSKDQDTTIKKYTSQIIEKKEFRIHKMLFTTLDENALLQPFKALIIHPNDGTGNARTNLLAEYFNLKKGITKEAQEASVDAKIIAAILDNGQSGKLASTKTAPLVITGIKTWLEGFIDIAQDYLDDSNKRLASAQEALKEQSNRVTILSSDKKSKEADVQKSSEEVTAAQREHNKNTSVLEAGTEKGETIDRQTTAAQGKMNETGQGINKGIGETTQTGGELSGAQGEAGEATTRQQTAQQRADDSASTKAGYENQHQVAQDKNIKKAGTLNENIASAPKSTVKIYGGEVPTSFALRFQHTREIMANTPISEAYLSTLSRRRQGPGGSTGVRSNVVYFPMKASNGITTGQVFGEILDQNDNIQGSSSKRTATQNNIPTAQKKDYVVILVDDNSDLAKAAHQMDLSNEELASSEQDVKEVKQIAEEDKQKLLQADNELEAAQQKQQIAEQNHQKSQQSLNESVENYNNAKAELDLLEKQKQKNQASIEKSQQMVAASEADVQAKKAIHQTNTAELTKANAALNTAQLEYDSIKVDVDGKQKTVTENKGAVDTAQNNKAFVLLNSKTFKSAVLGFQLYNLKQIHASYLTEKNEKGIVKSLMTLGLAVTDVAFAIEDLVVRCVGMQSKLAWLREISYDIKATELAKIFRKGGLLPRELNITRLVRAQYWIGLASACAYAYDVYYYSVVNDSGAVAGAALGSIGSLTMALSGYLAAGLLGPVAWTGVVMIVAGLVVTYVFSLTDFETWLVNGPFSDDGSTGLPYLIDPYEAYYRLLGLFVQMTLSLEKTEIDADTYVRYTKTQPSLSGMGTTKSVFTLTVNSSAFALVGSETELIIKGSSNRAILHYPTKVQEFKLLETTLTPQGVNYILGPAREESAADLGASSTAKAKVQFKVKYKGQDFYFPAPKVKDAQADLVSEVTQNGCPEADLSIGSGEQTFWASVATNRPS